MMKEFLGNSHLFGANAPFIDALYESYLADPQSVEPRWRGYFDELQKLDDGPRDVSHFAVQERFAAMAKAPRPQVAAAPADGFQKQFAVLQLIAAYRFQGARVADVDPLGRIESRIFQNWIPRFTG